MSFTIRLKDTIKWAMPDSVLFRIAPPTVRVYARIMTWYTCGQYHNAPVDPLEIIKIDPFTVEERLTPEGFSRFEYSSAVSEVINIESPGTTQYIKDYDLYNAIIKHFCNGIEWECTNFFDRVEKEFEEGKYKWGCSNISDFRARLSDIDELYEKINSNGYRTQLELRNAEDPNPGYRDIHRLWPPELHEVSVYVNKEGELILHDGRHRFSIARVLGLDKIPVRVKGRHVEWQKKRDEIFKSGDVPEGLKNHPDIRSLGSGESLDCSGFVR